MTIEPSHVLGLAGALGAAVLALRRYSPLIYDTIILHMTSVWYATTFAKIARTQQQQKKKKDSDGPFRLLDVGIGTASALIAVKDSVRATKVQVVGVDYDSTYIKAARSNVVAAGMEDQVTLHCASIYEADAVEEDVVQNGLFDAGYFSGSFSLMPDPLEALSVVAKLVKPGGHVYITQTFQRRGFPGLSIIKPLTKYATTIDFGQLFYESELDAVLVKAEKKGLKLVSNEVIDGSVDNMFQAARCVCLKVV